MNFWFSPGASFSSTNTGGSYSWFQQQAQPSEQAQRPSRKQQAQLLLGRAFEPLIRLGFQPRVVDCEFRLSTRGERSTAACQ